MASTAPARQPAPIILTDGMKNVLEPFYFFLSAAFLGARQAWRSGLGTPARAKAPRSGIANASARTRTPSYRPPAAPPSDRTADFDA